MADRDSDACGEPRRGARNFAVVGVAAILLLVAGACARRPERPSILLVVLDTTRADAVSAYGAVAGTTPATDALARDGLRYTHARVQAPWTLPSHATLFTGLLPSAHGVSWRHTRASDGLTMLAELMRDGGYQTFGVAENPWVSEAFNMTQGFDDFRIVKGFTLDPHAAEGHDDEVRAVVTAWLASRRRERPFFLFVNVLDAHLPYLVRAENPFLPAGVSADEARAVPQSPEEYFCNDDASPGALATLRGLYLGGVRAADDKLRQVLEALEHAGAARDLVTVVTSDHGEHFGEHALVGHQFSVYEQLLHVPLVVHGLPRTDPAVIDTPVTIADVMPTILDLAGIRAPEGLAGRVLPTSAGDHSSSRAIVAEHDDSDAADDDDPHELAAALRRANREVRKSCAESDRVFGEMRALVRDDMKLIWYERHPPALYDLRADPGERNDVSAARAADTRALAAELRAIVERAAAAAPAASRREATAPDAGPAASPLPAEIHDRLRALGYLRDGGHEPTPAP